MVNRRLLVPAERLLLGHSCRWHQINERPVSSGLPTLRR